MANFKLCVCAESAVRDAESDSISVFNIIEGYSSDDFPVVIPKLSCVFMVEREDGDPNHLDCSLVFSIDDEEINRSPTSIDFQGKEVARLVAQVRGAMIPRPGTFKACLRMEDGTEGAWTMDVEKTQTEVEVEQK